MSDFAELVPIEAQPQERRRPWLEAIDRVMDRLGDWLNPILIKEARQALKSRQFVVTFCLLLLLAWAVSLIGLTAYGSDAAYESRGAEMFFAYYCLLAFSLLVIVPFGALRSLAAEQEDRTYELMSITTLNPRQIIAGKLGSAVMQMVIYLSAISPCLAFTYMLRGISFPLILFILFWTVLASLGLSVIGLLFGTLTHQRQLQVVLSVMAVLGLLFAFGGALGLCSSFLYWWPLSFSDPIFWQVNAGLVAGYLSYFLLIFYAAVAQITFASDNRSTRLRVIMVLQFLLLTGWMAWGWLGPAEREYEMLMFYAIVAGLHWFVMGAMTSGEWSELSIRVKRNLPQSFLGRAFLTWFNPGPATGYLFAVGGALATLAVVVAAMPWTRSWPGGAGSDWIFQFCYIGLCYLVIYLGVGLLLVRLVRKIARVDVPAALLLQALLVFLGCLVPTILRELSPQTRYQGYSLLQVTNFFWTLIEVGGRPNAISPYIPSLITLLTVAAAAVFLANLPAVVRELRHVRIAPPPRVAEEDAALAAQLNPPPPPQPLSPWD